FFLSSSLLSRIGGARKAAARAQFSKGEQRDLAQVLANGGVALLAALAFGLHPAEGWWALFVGALATATADTWATELGTLSRGQPRLITNGRRVERGTSGAVSGLGLAATIAGAAFIAGGGALLEGQVALGVMIAGTLGGTLGSLADSWLGATLQARYTCPGSTALTEKNTCPDGAPARLVQGWPWMDNDLVNGLATLVGGVLSLAVWVGLVAGS
ncbi:MAG: DUF92 domain-containing protein, partial [Anaerolineae bacterium]|nr:DUF92 domain-containing protein [Anaerolineae bacterium]